MSSWARLLRTLTAAMLAVALAQPAVAWRDAAQAQACTGHAAHGAPSDSAAAVPTTGPHDDAVVGDAGCAGAATASSCTASDCAGTCAALPSAGGPLAVRVATAFLPPSAPPGWLGEAAPPETPPPIA